MKFLRKKPVLIIIGIILALIVAMVITSQNRTVSAPENLVGNIMTPVENAAGTAVDAVINFFKNLFGVSDAQKENQTLKAAVMALEAENSRLNAYIAEMGWQKEYQDYIEKNPQYTQVALARVSAKNPGYWFDNFLISAGRNQGVEVNMPVITTTGLVGRVIEVGGNWSKVMAIIDGSSSVAAMVERTRDNGIVRGNLELGATDDLCVMYYLPIDNDLVPGDVIITSGLDQIFPRGITIGTVTAVSRSDTTGERTATIKPSVEFAALEQVIVIDNAQGQ